jgi:hypothetical protein
MRRAVSRWFAGLSTVLLAAGASAVTTGNTYVFRSNTDAVCPETVGLTNPSRIHASPDGEFVYTVGTEVTVWHRDAATGRLTFVETHANGSGVNGLNSMAASAFSADFATLYVGGVLSSFVPPLGNLLVFTRDPSTGRLAFVESFADSFGGVSGITRPTAVVVSGDGEHVYVVSTDPGFSTPHGSIALFDRNPATGRLTFVTAWRNGQGGVSGLATARGAILSADGSFLYVSGATATPGTATASVATFARDAGTGLLTFLSEIHRATARRAAPF